MRYCLTLDLKNDPKLIAEYKEHHAQVWPEILDSIKDSGIESMEIYQVSNRLFMIMETNETFSFERKRTMDQSNEKVAAWESLMDTYQARLPFANPEEKWVLMDLIFEL